MLRVMNMSDAFNKELPRSCKYCAFGKDSLFGGEVLCKKRGVTSPTDYCRHYKYDPLRRVPEKVKIADGYKPEDFSL